MSSTQNVKTTIDVRTMIPRERHPLIFGTFDQLVAEEALLLVNDHDPKPLFYQFQAESKSEFTWDYLESGPDVWQVRIGKPAADAGPAATASRCCKH
jgi:uncharacterized protein (DUF2249 family)